MARGASSMGARTTIAAIGALLALVLQIVLAPNIAIAGTMPSFVIAYVVAMAMLLPSTPGYVIAFVLGMLTDLLGYGPVGVLPFILLIAVLSIDYAQKVFGNGTLFVSCIIVVAFVIAVHFFHAAFMVAVTSTYTLGDALLLIAIPQSLYDCIWGVLAYMLLRRILMPAQSSGMPQIGPLGR